MKKARARRVVAKTAAAFRAARGRRSLPEGLQALAQYEAQEGRLPGGPSSNGSPTAPSIAPASGSATRRPDGDQLDASQLAALAALTEFGELGELGADWAAG
ncbi:hypothetical protein OG594_44380 [Streptomyces sp. NBC_01214]|uniref:hypothetical protein n=1 Tax=Streptomyces sp. NBC_01214 TaxID=2903777 RepID=UPI002259458B|nr:hypothetical protein [Streptomyces sp. NBC_01214]MCX4808546.1 hypothetical protein [Streptomyces sp. NBC_01214]